MVNRWLILWSMEKIMKKIVILGFSILVITIGIATFLVARVFQPIATVSAQEGDQPEKSGKVIEIAVEENLNGEVTSGQVTITFEYPPMLPAERERVLGVFLSRDGDVLTLGTGSIEVEVAVEVVNDEEPVRTVNVSHSGDSVEVVINSDTIVYKDITPQPEVSSQDLETGHKVITSKVIPGSLDEVGEGMILRVWGKNQDGRVIASVLVYEEIGE